MKQRAMRVVFLWILLLLPAWAEPTHFRLATAAEGRQVLTARDEFVRALSPSDRSARLHTAAPVGEERFLQFVGEQAQEWTPGESERVNAACRSLSLKLEKLQLPGVEEVLLIKTTGEEEGHAPHTRGSAIILPPKAVVSVDLEGILTHEYFHVLSRQHPELHDKVYALVGFQPCPEVVYPEELKNRKITNPDAVSLSYCIQLGNSTYIPILYATYPNYNQEKGGDFFQQMEFKLLDTSSGKVVRPGPEYGRKTGGNTGYVIHPEEVSADTFVLLVQGRKAANPELVEGLRKALQP